MKQTFQTKEVQRIRREMKGKRGAGSVEREEQGVRIYQFSQPNTEFKIIIEYNNPDDLFDEPETTVTIKAWLLSPCQPTTVFGFPKLPYRQMVSLVSLVINACQVLPTDEILKILEVAQTQINGME